MIAKGKYIVKKWEENQYEQISTEMKLTKATVEYEMTGDIIGKAFVEYLMFYKYSDPNDQHKSSANYIGLIRFVGSIKGKNGSFVIEDRGTFAEGIASSSLKIISDSGMGELKGIKGTGQYGANKDGAIIEFSYILG